MKNLIKKHFNNKIDDSKIIYTLKIILSALLVYFISILLAEGIFIIISFILGYNITDNLMPFDIMLLYKFYGYIITIILFLLFTKRVNKLSLLEIGVNKNYKTFFKGILLGLLALILVILFLITTNAIKFNGINNNLNYTMIILYFFAYLIQSTMEELICRGYLLHRLKNKISVVASITISSTFFSIGHYSELFNDGQLIGIIGVVNLALISLIWITTTIKDKNIYSAIGFHFVWNFVLFNVIGLNLSGIKASNSILNFSPVNLFLTGKSYGIESSIIASIVLLFILCITNIKLKSR